MSAISLKTERCTMSDASFIHRTWIEIDLDRLTANYRTACSLTRAKVTCVVKSNAYGHGAVQVAKCLQAEGCDSFAVSCVREGLELRRHGIEGEILVMGLSEPEALDAAIRAGLTLTVGSTGDLRALEAAAAVIDEPVTAQLKFDTGFHRLGFVSDPAAAEEIAALLPGLGHVRVSGLYTHLGLINKERDILQHDRLLAMDRALREKGIALPDLHICDSIGLVRYPEWHHTRVRVGAFLYGVRPYHSEHLPFACEETLVLKTKVARVHTVAAGEVVGYGDDQIPDHEIRVATLCAGYGDGVPRCLSNGAGQVLIRGRKAPVIGLICMDQMMADVTEIPEVQPGDTVHLLGGGISYAEAADAAHTNRNEMITILSRRPVRVYLKNGQTVAVEDQLS